jgi:Cft2 family RNA processing exonuclease
LYAEFSRYGLEDWMDLYTEEDLVTFFNTQVVVLNHNEKYTYDNLVSLTPVSSGLHIGSSNWALEIAH